MKLGWLKPKVVTQSGWYTLNDVETHPEAYILYDPDHGTQEYFIVENRWPGTSYEAEFNGQGLAIWHIDESHQTGDHWGRKTIHLVRAGGIGAHDDKALWDGSDPQTGYDLTPDSFPSNTRWRDGSSSGISIKHIPAVAQQVKVYFEVP